MNITELIKEAHETACDKGFYDCPECNGTESIEGHDCCGGTNYNQNKNIGELLMLIVSELGEALEAHRSGRFADWEAFTASKGQDNYFDFSEPDNIMDFEILIKDTFEDEIADVFIRLFNLCGYLGIEIDSIPDWENNPFDIDNVGSQLFYIDKKLHKIEDSFGTSDETYRIKQTLYALDYFSTLHNIPIEKHITAKMAYNKTREKRHGKRY